VPAVPPPDRDSGLRGYGEPGNLLPAERRPPSDPADAAPSAARIIGYPENSASAQPADCGVTLWTCGCKRIPVAVMIVLGLIAIEFTVEQRSARE